MKQKNENGKNDQPKNEQKISDETQPEYRQISDEELKQILEDHKKWLVSNGKEGGQANLNEYNLKKSDLSKFDLRKVFFTTTNLQESFLRGTNLKKAILARANLQDADLIEADLEGAILSGADLLNADLIESNLYKSKLSSANLYGADLSRANLKEAKLYRANMKNTILNGVEGLNEANLHYADMQGATGLLGNEFAQADVTGTELPDVIKDFKALDIVEKTSQNARKIFFAMLLGCVYSWLTIDPAMKWWTLG